MNVNVAAERVGGQLGPPPAGNPVAFVVPFKSKLDRRLAVSNGPSIIDTCLDRQKSHRALAAPIKCEVCGTEQVKIRRVP